MSEGALLFKSVAIGCDHAAVDMKNEVKKHLEATLKVEKVVDIGVHTADRCDYPDKAAEVCQLIQKKEVEIGILLCGSGIGISIAANKHNGIRAALCHDYYCAQMAREHNDANVFCAGARTTGPEVIKQMVSKFLSTPFMVEGNHKGRVAKISALEQSEAAAAEKQ